MPHRRVVHAARLSGEKGHLLMLDVIARLSNKYTDLAYLIAGEGPMRDAIRHRASALGIEDRVALLGLVDNVPALMRQAELVVMPSNHEALGIAQIEALSLGVPVLASRVGGIPETITDEISGLLAPPEDLNAWVAMFDRALSQPETMLKMAQAGSADVLARYGLKTNIDQLLEHIGACCQR